MATERLQVILDMETGQYRREARRAADSTKEIGRGADQVGGKLQSLEGNLKRLGIAAAAGLGAAAGAFAASTLRSASDLTESINAVEKAFEGGAEAVLDFGEQAATSAGLAQSEFNQLVVPIGALLRNFGFGAEEAAEQAIALTQRAADLASVFNVDVSEALRAVQAALRGEGDPIEAFGANVSAARVEAYALAEGLVETKGEIDDNVKVMGRLGLIFEDTERFAGDFGDTAGEAANQVKTLSAEWENFKADVGTDLLDPASTALTFAGRSVSFFGTFFNFIKSPLDEVQRTLDQIPLSVNRLRKEVGGFEGQEGAALLQLLSNIPRQALESSEVLEEFADELNLTGDDLEELLDILADTDGWEDAEDAADKLAAIMGITRREAEDLLPRLEDLRVSLEDQDWIDNQTRRWQGLAEAYGINAEAAGGAADENNELAASFLNVLNARRELQDPLFAAAQSQQRKSGARDDLNEAIASGDTEAIARAQLDYIEATAEADIATENFAANFSESFAAVLESSELTRDELLDTLDVLGLLNDLRPIDIIITSRSLDELKLALQNLIGAPKTFPGVGSSLSSTTTVAQPRAGGGPINASEPYIVGEQGPELVIPGVSSFVVPNNQLGGSTVINLGGIAINGINTPDPLQLARSIRREMDRELTTYRGGTV